LERQLNGKTIIFDFDGVVCANNNGDYANSPPYPHAIEQISKVYDLGYKVVLFTARYGDRLNGCAARQYNAGYEEWLTWMRKHNVKYDEAWMGKPAGSMYVDDKACKVDSSKGLVDWTQNFWPQLAALNKVDKYNQPITELEKQAENLKEFKAE
jgi:capsule biosynthesis phosphatase